MEMDVHKWITLGLGVYAAITTIAIFVGGREFFRLDKWKDTISAAINRESERNESLFKEYKAEIKLLLEAHKAWVMTECDKMNTYDRDYRKQCVFNVYSEIKRLNGDSKHDAREIGKLVGDHRVLENIVDNIRQFYEENRSLLEDKVGILKMIENYHRIDSERITQLEKIIEEIKIMQTNLPPLGSL
jgi:predicted AAA+ superfamily ATPase